MKRSDMIKKLTKYWNEWEEHPSSEEIAKHSLDIIEEAGMLPPMFEKKKLQGFFEISIKKNEWESEAPDDWTYEGSSI